MKKLAEYKVESTGEVHKILRHNEYTLLRVTTAGGDVFWNEVYPICGRLTGTFHREVTEAYYNDIRE